MPSRRIFPALAGMLLFMAISAAAQNYHVGQANPAFDLPRWSAGRLTSSDFPGRILLLNFFGYN
jgi:hypothetical protein